MPVVGKCPWWENARGWENARVSIVGVSSQTVNVSDEITSESRTDLNLRCLYPKQSEEVGKIVWIPPTLSDKTVGCAEPSTSPAR